MSENELSDFVIKTKIFIFSILVIFFLLFFFSLFLDKIDEAMTILFILGLLMAFFMIIMLIPVDGSVLNE